MLGLAAAIPLLIHLLRRRMGNRVEFPAARYLARAERENSRQLRIRNILLMSLRMLAVLLLAIAAARPIASVAGIGHAPTSVAIVVDNSLSSSVIVDGRPLLDLLRDTALELLDHASSSDRFWLVTSDAETLSGSIAVVRAGVLELRPAAGTGEMSLALARATALLDASRTPEKRIALLTDAQRFEWRGVERVQTGEAAVSIYSPLAVLPPNRSVSSVEVRPSHWTPMGEVLARVVGPDSVSYRIDLGERPLARGTAAPGEEIVVRASPPERGWHSGLVEIQPDELRADDSRYFAVWIGAAPLAMAHASAGPFIVSALDALAAAGRVAAGSSIVAASADEADHLPALIFPPEDPVKIGAANRALQRLGVPWRFGQAIRAGETVRATGSTAWNDDAVSVTLRYELEASGAAASDTVAMAGNKPWLIVGDRYALFASPANPDASSLPLRASFIPLIAELVTQRLSGEGGRILTAFPGAQVTRPIWADAIRENGSLRLLEGGTFKAPATSGVWMLARAGQPSGALVVNPPAGEFDLARMPRPDLRARFEVDNVSITSDAPRWTRDVLDSSGRRPVALPLLFAAFVALALESLVARDGGGARKS
jgi:hypothetical protein